MPDLLELTADQPEIDLAPGDVLIEDGTRTGSIWVLVSGAVEVRKSGSLINTISRPGTSFGEVSVLQGTDHGADIVAVEPTRMRYVRDGRGLLFGNPEVLWLVAAGLAERLDLITGYLADLRNQYTGVPGIDMVSTVLGRLTGQDVAPAQPGSARDPDPEY